MWHFIACTALFILHQLSQYWQLSLPFLDHYLDPFLLMPILLCLIQWEQQKLFKKKGLHTLQILVWTAVVAIASEYFFPKWKPQFISDWKDVAAYTLGALYFKMFMNKR